MRTGVRTARGLALACHPGPTVVVTSLTAALAVGIRSAPATAVLVTAAVLTGQLSVGWSNDWIDSGRDLAVSRAAKPVVSGLLSPALLRTAALTAAALCVPISLSTGAVPGLVHLLAVASAWGYNVWLKGTVASWVPYAVSFGLLPVFVVLAQPGRPLTTWWAVAAASLLGVGAHVANVLPDLEDDGLTGVHGLPHRLGRTRSTVLAFAAMLAATAVVVLAPGGPPSTGSLLGAGVAAVLASAGAAVGLVARRSRLPFVLSMAVAVVCVVLLVRAGPDLVQASAAVLSR
jgi:4-hydroxybenzoate polyprenyltransferase